MQAFQIDQDYLFHDRDPFAQPLSVDKSGRILRFMLKPGQSVVEHTAPHSPVYIVVVAGTGLFSGAGGEAQSCGPGALLVFAPGEPHAIHAQEEALVFLAFLHGAPGAQ
ncbi:MAG: cupin domain-containing protein [Caldilineales bacterium]|nr:cupin domain-containing protein [Caldilineales bacterium]MCW5881150.1 cupin domain-containing protein [Anaerolineae bacterium]